MGLHHYLTVHVSAFPVASPLVSTASPLKDHSNNRLEAVFLGIVGSLAFKKQITGSRLGTGSEPALKLTALVENGVTEL